MVNANPTPDREQVGGPEFPYDNQATIPAEVISDLGEPPYCNCEGCQ